MFSKFSAKKIWLLSILSVTLLIGATAYAFHGWGNYHWARTANPFTVKLGDNVSSSWEPYLNQASSDWSQSAVLGTTVVRGLTIPRSCRGTLGMVEVCSSKYGYNGWLGIASIWVQGDHITKGTVKLNDSYFNTKTYSKPPWKLLVMCQEIGHTFGLGHQDEGFYNDNLGTCMDYTANPVGPPSNEHPGNHDYEQLELTYAHLDSITTLAQQVESNKARDRTKRNEIETINFEGINLEEWLDARKEKADLKKEEMKNKLSVLMSDLGKGEKVIDFILWLPE